MEANIHFADAGDAHKMMGAVPDELGEGNFADRFHVFEIEWDEDRIVWRVDGEEYASCEITTDEKSEFHQNFFILLNVALGGSWAGSPDSTTGFPQYMYVDWVRAFQQG